jgi:hypothetical protein
MRGSPLLRTFVVLFILILAAFPIWKLTHKAERVAVAEQEVSGAKRSVRVELAFAPAPAEFQLLHLGKIIWEAKSPGETAEKEFEMEFPKEGIDLEIKSAWASGASNGAVRVSVTPGDAGTIEKTAWGTGSVDEVLTFCESKEAR